MSKPPASARRTQAERSATASRRMIRVAIKLMAANGFTKTSLTEVGKEAGYTGGLVSHHFGSKEGLLRAVVGRISARFVTDQIQPATDGLTGTDAICALAATYLNELSQREERMRALYVLMGEALGPVSEVNEIFAELNNGFRIHVGKQIRTGIENGTIRPDVDPEAEGAVVLGMLRGLAMQWISDPGSFDVEAASQSVQQKIRAGLAPAEGS